MGISASEAGSPACFQLFRSYFKNFVNMMGLVLRMGSKCPSKDVAWHTLNTNPRCWDLVAHLFIIRASTHWFQQCLCENFVAAQLPTCFCFLQPNPMPGKQREDLQVTAKAIISILSDCGESVNDDYFVSWCSAISALLHFCDWCLLVYSCSTNEVCDTGDPCPFLHLAPYL